MAVPVFPVVIDYGDGDCERFDSFDAFLASSGCEEDDFAADAPVVVDVRRRCFAFSHGRKRFTELTRAPSAQAQGLLPPYPEPA